MSLDRDDVLAAAVSLLDAYGLGDLSMRRIAGNLGVAPGALYWHFANKQELLGAVADSILADLPDPAGARWDVATQAWAARLHTLLRNHRSGAELVSSVLALRGWDASPAMPIARIIAGAGASPELARSAASGVLHLVLGHTMDEEQAATSAELGVRTAALPADSAGILDQAVALLVAGVEAQLAQSEALSSRPRARTASPVTNA